MAGHSKWANIKYRKERADAAKGKLFSRIAKEIISAVKQGGADPKSNAKLRLVLEKAKTANVPNDNIERNIKKASQSDQADYFEMIYELYGHGGVGIIAEVMTDNRNRIASEMRIATNKKGGNIATPGAVAFNFEQKGMLEIEKTDNIDSDVLFLLATESGAEDFEEADGIFFITTLPQELYEVKKKIEEKGYTCRASLERIPKTYVDCSSEVAELNKELIEWLERLEDVDTVYNNMKIIEEQGTL